MKMKILKAMSQETRNSGFRTLWDAGRLTKKRRPDVYQPARVIMYNGRRMSPASIGGGFHLRLSVGVIIPH